MSKEHSKISDLKEGQAVHAAYLLSNIRPSVTKLGSPFFFAELKDASGTIPAVCWKPDGSITPEQNGSIFTIAGTVTSYNEQLQFSIETAELINPADINDALLSELVPTAPINLEEYTQALSDLIFSIQDQDIREICNFELLFNVYDKFIRYPAAKTVHHAFLHGLLMHSVDMAKLADTMSTLKPNAFSRDLLIAGALMHDVGKTIEFEVSPVTGLVTGYTAEGNLLGHSTIGAREVEEAASTVGARDEVSLLLQHMRVPACMAFLLTI